MPTKPWQWRILVLLLAVAFLLPQLHSCADLASNSYGSHFCPLCTAAVPAVVSPQQGIALIPIFSRLENAPSSVRTFSSLPRSTPSRAPPSL